MTITANKKSESLTSAEVQALKDIRSSHSTATDCAISLRISREVLLRVLLAGSGSPKTIKKIRTALKKVAVTN